MRRLLSWVATPLRRTAERSATAKMKDALALSPVGQNGCAACGATGDFDVRPVLSRDLSRQWRLTAEQRVAINIQQGHSCRQCGNNVRGRALAAALVRRLGASGSLKSAAVQLGQVSVLEVNPAASLSPFLDQASRHVCTHYPAVDMEDLPFSDGEFDFVVHSDVLEHVTDPSAGLRECLRVAQYGWVVFTTPVLHDRTTRSRNGLGPSFHGGDSGPSRVAWEFGADFPDLLVAAGATTVEIDERLAPYALVYSCHSRVQPGRDG